MNAEERPDCYRCRAFFVTYEPAHPYGCRTFSMKTKALPSLVVQSSSGSPCGAFDPKRPADGPSGSVRDRGITG